VKDIDAELLALEISRQLLPPSSLYEQIHSDLTSIRAAYPAIASIHHQPLWIPGELVGKLTAEAMAQFKKGDYHGLDALSAQYGPIKIIPLDNDPKDTLNFVTFKFSRWCNPECLTRLISAADGVWYAHSKWISDEGNRIEVSDSQYTFSVGWGNCSLVCSYRHYWVFSVVDGLAQLVTEHGDPLLGDLSVASDSPTTVGGATKLMVKAGGNSHPDVSCAWDFGDGTPVQDGGAEITHTYPAMGEYTAIVTASSFGHIATAATTVTVTS
jgi:hypothetical protein